MLKQRLLYGSLMIIAIMGIVILDGWLSQGALVKAASRPEAAGAALVRCALPITMLVVLLAILATYEMAQLCRAGGYRPAGHWAAIVSAGLVFVPWLEMQRLSVPVAIPIPLSLWWLTGGLLGTCLALLLRKTTERALTNMALTLFLILYLGLLGSFAVRIRCMYEGAAGAALIVYFILTVKSSDIGAYFTGVAIGRHKLIPWLSPGKTIEGAGGAVVFAALVGMGGMLLWRTFPALGTPPLTLAQALVFGVVMAVAGHLGDLTESAFKRDMGLKDSGQVVPAFGGLLDILDSPLFTAPIAWFLLTIWTPTR
jgi:phosphatidate cytidylyltransferase